MRIRQVITDIREVGHDVLQSTQSAKTGALMVNIGDAVSGQPYSEGCPVWNATVGVMCRPANPTQGQNSCQTLEFTGSDQNTVIAMRDLRSAQSVGALAPGDSCVYESAAGKARIYARASGQIDIIANNGSQSIVISPSGDITITAKDVTVNASGSATVHANTSATVSAGTSASVDAPSVSIGASATSVQIAGAVGFPAARLGDTVQAGPFAGAITKGSLTTTIGG